MTEHSVFSDKTVLITGNSGFKGAWLTSWFISLNANVVGYSKEIPTRSSLFKCLNLEKKIRQHWADVRDFESLNSCIANTRPDFVFHLAAQPLVRKSYQDPLTTFETNANGTLNLLEALRNRGEECVLVAITSDKVYDNVEWEWGYRENDTLGGKDPYSGSKAAAELILKSYVSSFFQDSPLRVGITRAGNVIGGGDWAEDRIVPDAVRAWSKGKKLVIRNPVSTRPWQHVLEPLYGYIKLAISLAESPELHGQAFNFGPPMDQNASVLKLIEEMQKHWASGEWEVTQNDDEHPESQLLKLNCDKALQRLAWSPVLDFEESVRMTTQWYKNHHEDTASIQDITQKQIEYYSSLHGS